MTGIAIVEALAAQLKSIKPKLKQKRRFKFLTYLKKKWLKK